MGFRAFLGTVIFMAASAQAAMASNVTSQHWRIVEPQWLPIHEDQFGQFVTKLGEAVEQRKCAKVDDCLKSDANLFNGTDPAGLRYYADCADLPYYLRGYFAWKLGLPFSFASEVRPNALPNNGTEPTAAAKDPRYTPQGNYISKRFDILTQANGLSIKYPSAVQMLNTSIINLTFSATFRNPGIDESGLFSDFYPVSLNRQGVRPGTIIYDPNGHVAVVYKVSDDGRIFYIDAHPDNSLTMGMFTPKFVRSNPAQGAGFKNFRPLRLEGAEKNIRGVYTGGKIVGLKNAELANFGTEQFFGTHPDSNGWNRGKFILNGQTLSFYEYVRLKLMVGEVHIDPLKDMAQVTDDICVSLKDRVDAIDTARKASIHLKPHPERLPFNIFGTEGEWENYATPSRDARLKVAFMDLLAQTKNHIARYKAKDRALRYQGGNLAKDLYAVYAARAQACQFDYTTSNGRIVRMNLEAARQRVFAMSFDPYHCPELRWGARTREELASCQDDNNKREWYNREQWLRNQFERTYDARMDYSLSELTGPLPGAGIEHAPDIDIVNYLKSEM